MERKLKATGEKSRNRTRIRNAVVLIRGSGSVLKSHGSTIVICFPLPLLVRYRLRYRTVPV
jgi:hypothetical protein